MSHYFRTCLTLFLVAGFLSCDKTSPFRDFGIDTSITSMKDQDGNAFDLKQLRSKVVLLYFGFTYCPEICPMNHSKLSKAWAGSGYRKKNLEIVMITIDPKRDSSALLKKYLSSFEKPGIGLTGSDAAIADVAKRYGIYYEKVPIGKAGDYTMNHTASVFLLDTEGQLRYIFPYASSSDEIRDISKLLLPVF